MGYTDQSSNTAETAQQSASVMRERSPGRGQPIPVVVGNGKAPNSDTAVNKANLRDLKAATGL